MKLKKKLSQLIRKLILTIIDPIVKRKVGNKYIYMHLSHMWPSYREEYILYDTAIARIASYIYESKSDVINIVDVGANVGDTASLILSTVKNSRIVCVEGNPKYLPLLHRNFDSSNSVIIEDAYCGEQSEEILNLSIHTKDGTARLIHSQANNKNIKFKTVDEIVSAHFESKSFDLLKVDTDGFDYKVLRGAENSIKEIKPIVFFELDKHFLLLNNEEPMAIFGFFKNCDYSSFIAYDNFGYLIGLFEIDENNTIKKLIDYFYSKHLYLDILMIPDESLANSIYNQEKIKISSMVGMH